MGWELPFDQYYYGHRTIPVTPENRDTIDDMVAAGNVETPTRYMAKGYRDIVEMVQRAEEVLEDHKDHYGLITVVSTDPSRIRNSAKVKMTKALFWRKAEGWYLVDVDFGKVYGTKKRRGVIVHWEFEKDVKL